VAHHTAYGIHLFDEFHIILPHPSSNPLPRQKQLPKTEGVSAHRSVVGKRTKFEIESLEIFAKKAVCIYFEKWRKVARQLVQPKKRTQKREKWKEKKVAKSTKVVKWQIAVPPLRII